MTHEEAKAQLLAWHFGQSEQRDALEVHLISCHACAIEFVALKRAIELGDEERPSVSARSKLRAAAMASFEWKWWERPVAFIGAAAAVVAALALLP